MSPTFIIYIIFSAVVIYNLFKLFKDDIMNSINKLFKKLTPLMITGFNKIYNPLCEYKNMKCGGGVFDCHH